MPSAAGVVEQAKAACHRYRCHGSLSRPLTVGKQGFASVAELNLPGISVTQAQARPRLYTTAGYAPAQGQRQG